MRINPLRLFDTKDARVAEVMRDAPKLIDHLSPAAQAHREAVTDALGRLGIPFVEDPALVRGFDYYTMTVFEFTSEHLGAQSAVGGGGRYDGLVEALGGPHTPAIGWAAGIERLAMMIDAPSAEVIDAAIVVEHDGAMDAAWAAASRLRKAGLSVELVASGSPRKRFDRAVKKGAREIIVLGVADGEVTRRVKSNDEPRVEALLA